MSKTDSKLLVTEADRKRAVLMACSTLLVAAMSNSAAMGAKLISNGDDVTRDRTFSSAFDTAKPNKIVNMMEVIDLMIMTSTVKK